MRPSMLTSGVRRGKLPFEHHKDWGFPVDKGPRRMRRGLLFSSGEDFQTPSEDGSRRTAVELLFDHCICAIRLRGTESLPCFQVAQNLLHRIPHRERCRSCPSTTFRLNFGAPFAAVRTPPFHSSCRSMTRGCSRRFGSPIARPLTTVVPSLFYAGAEDPRAQAIAWRVREDVLRLRGSRA